MGKYRSSVGPIAVFKKINTLPSAQHQTARKDRDCQWNRHHCGFDVGRHIIWTFHCMTQIAHWLGIAAWNQAWKIRLQISLNIGVRIFLDQKRAGCMSNKEGEDTWAYIFLGHKIADFGCKFVKACACRCDLKLSLHDDPTCWTYLLQLTRIGRCARLICGCLDHRI